MTEYTPTQQYRDVEDFYQSLHTNSKSEEQPSIGFSVGLFFTKIWNKTPLKKLKTVTKILYVLRSSIIDNYDENDVRIKKYKKYAENVSKNEYKYKKIYHNLCDEKSKRTMMCVLRFRVDGNYETLHAESDYIYKQYFDKNIMKFSENEVFVDCGGFIGDTVSLFIDNVQSFKKIHVYEPDPINYRKATKLLSKNEKDNIDKIQFHNTGVGIENISSKMSLSGLGSKISDNGDYDVQIVSLDDDIHEPITFIKMDIEGFELDALKGARNHILSNKPKLAICVYHKPDDLWEIPEYILSLNPEYKLYLRQYMFNDGENAFDTILYAI